MSGPKIIRIVTREEKLAMCEGHLTHLDETIARWTRVGLRNDTIDEGAITAIKTRREAIRMLVEKDRFSEAQKQALAEMAFLQSDIDARLRKSVEAAAKTRQERRNLASTAATLLSMILSAQKKIPETLRHNLEMAKNGEGDHSLATKAISQAFACLEPPKPTTDSTSRQREIARKLTAEPAENPTLADWLATQPKMEDDVSCRIDGLISELEILAGHETAKPYNARLKAITKEGSRDKQSLLSDSLLLDLAAVLKEQRIASETKSNLAVMHSQIIRFNTVAAQSLTAEIDVVLKTNNVKEAKLLITRAERLVAEEIKTVADVARRKAVLNGLAKLGYEVREGMTAVWIREGKVIVPKAANPMYGVEFTSIKEGERMQARVVRFENSDTSSDPARDRDMEGAWCNEYQRLQELIVSTGGSATLERALLPGDTPVKTVNVANERGLTKSTSSKRNRSI